MGDHGLLIIIILGVIGLCGWRLIRHEPYKRQLQSLPGRTRKNAPVLLHKAKRAAGRGIKAGLRYAIVKADNAATGFLRKRQKRHAKNRPGALMGGVIIKLPEPTGRVVGTINLAGLKEVKLFAKRHSSGLVFGIPHGSTPNKDRTLATWYGYSFGFLESTPPGKNWFQMNIKGKAFVMIYPQDCDDIDEARKAWVTLAKIAREENA